MNVTTEIKMDLVKRGIIPVIDAVQGDALTRQIRIVLYSGGTEWTVPEGVSAMARFVRPDGSGGLYDTLDDGTAAFSVSGNVMTVVLAPAVTAVSGSVFFAVTLVQGSAELSTFTMTIYVQKSPSATSSENGEYVQMNSFLPNTIGAAAGKYLCVKETDASGRVTVLETVGTDTTLSESGKAADAKAVGDAIGDINAVLDAINGEAV